MLLHGGASHYEVFILHSDLTDGDEADIRTALPDVDFHFVFVDPAMFDGFPESKRYPRQIYYRIAAPLLLPDTLERILYLDADTVIINPLTALYATPFGDAYFMACTHTRKLLEKLNAARLGMDEAAPYINTGVLLYNLPALRADLDMERVRAFADEKQDVFLLPDQDILTALYGDRVHLLDSMVYNLSDRILALHNAELRNAPVDLDWVRAHTVIIHYCGSRSAVETALCRRARRVLPRADGRDSEIKNMRSERSTHVFLSAQAAEERAQDIRAVICQHAAVDGGMVAVALLKEVEHAAARAEVWLPRAVDDDRHAGVDDRPGAHGARLKCDIERACVKPPRAARGMPRRWPPSRRGRRPGASARGGCARGR